MRAQLKETTKQAKEINIGLKNNNLETKL